MDLQNPRTIHFVDLETTHLNPVHGEIIDICILTSKDWGKTLDNIYCTKIKPVHIETAAGYQSKPTSGKGSVIQVTKNK